MTITIQPDAEPIPESWRNPSLAEHLKPGQIGELTAERGMLARYLHCIAPGEFVLSASAERIAPASKADPMATLGPKLWRKLFTAPESAEGQAVALAEVERELPPKCGCLIHWRAFKRANPPSFGARFSEWVTQGLNGVRKRQGKSAMTIEQARARYTGNA